MIPLDSFEADVPITREDIEAQARIHRERRLSTAEYLEWCSWITRDYVAPCRDRHTEPFELPPSLLQVRASKETSDR